MEGVGPLAAVLWVFLLALVSVVTVSRPTKGAAAFHEHTLPLLTSELVKRLHNSEHVHHLSRNHQHLASRLEANIAAVAADIHSRHQQQLLQQQQQQQQNCTHEECVDFLRSPHKIKLTTLQRQQVVREQHFIRRLKCLENFERADPKELKREIVELTHGQKNDILTYYRSYFQNALSLPPVPTKRVKRGLRICPRQQSWDDLYLALTNDDEVVQVVQVSTHFLSLFSPLQQNCNGMNGMRLCDNQRLK